MCSALVKKILELFFALLRPASTIHGSLCVDCVLQSKVAIGSATLYHAKCEDVLSSLDTKSFDAVITDPPYLYLNQKLDASFDEERVFAECYRILKDNTIMSFFGRGQSFFRWNVMLYNLGLRFKESAVWEKENASNFLCNFLRIHEDICFREKGKRKMNKCFIDYIEYSMSLGRLDRVVELWKRLKHALESKDRDAVLEYVETGYTEFTGQKQGKHYITAGRGIKNEKRNVSIFGMATKGKIETSVMRCQREQFTYEHPTQKHVRLMERIINLTTNEDEIIIDPFTRLCACGVGGGSTIIAAVNTGRKAIGIECDKEYFDIAVANVKKAYEKKLNTQ